MKNALALLLAAIPALAAADVTVEKQDFGSWKDCYKISNGIAEVVVAPQIGRVVRYGYVGRPNMLWEGSNTLIAGDHMIVNGGDPDLDGKQPWTVEAVPNGIRLISPVSTKLKVRVYREITMINAGTFVHLRNRLENEGPTKSFDFAESTLVDDPFSAYLPYEAVGQNPNGWRMLVGSQADPQYTKRGATGIQITRNPSIRYKYGAFSSSGELYASKGTTVFRAKAKVFRGLGYPSGSPLQIATYSDPDKAIELITSAPTAKLNLNENSILEIDWQLTEGK